MHFILLPTLSTLSLLISHVVGRSGGWLVPRVCVIILDSFFHSPVSTLNLYCLLSRLFLDLPDTSKGTIDGRQDYQGMLDVSDPQEEV